MHCLLAMVEQSCDLTPATGISNMRLVSAINWYYVRY